MYRVVRTHKHGCGDLQDSSGSQSQSGGLAGKSPFESIRCAGIAIGVVVSPEETCATENTVPYE